MTVTSHDFCDFLGRKRTVFGNDFDLKPDDSIFLCKFYFYTYGLSIERSTRHRLQRIRALSAYVWILVATSVTFKQISNLQNFEACYQQIRFWLHTYPVSKNLEEKARTVLQDLDNKREQVFYKAKEIGKRLSRIKGPNLLKTNAFPVDVDSSTAEDTLAPDPSIQISTSTNEGVQEKQRFLRSIEAVCQVDQASIKRVASDKELNDLLSQPFRTPIIWREFTQHYPLHGIPSSIPELLQELRHNNIEYLDVYNYAETTTEKVNYREHLDKITEHFKARPESCPPLNFLDIRNQIISRVPVHVNKVDLLRLARRWQAGSASKSRPQGSQHDYSDHEFFLLSSRNSVSPLHVDTAGQLTYIIGISGRKIWYLPRNLTPETHEILATLGSSIPETYAMAG